MKKMHKKQGGRIQNGEPFDWMLDRIARDLNQGILSDKINPTDVSRYALILIWRKMKDKGYEGYNTIPQAALDMLKERIEDVDL